METANPLELLVQTASGFQGVKDPTPFLKEARLPAGSAWCMAFVQFCLKQVEEKLGVRSPIYTSGLAMAVWDKTPKEFRRPLPTPGAIAIWEHGSTIYGHCGIVTRIISNGNNYITVEGNTSDPSNKGNGIYSKVHPLHPPIGKLMLKGFLMPFGA